MKKVLPSFGGFLQKIGTPNGNFSIFNVTPKILLSNILQSLKIFLISDPKRRIGLLKIDLVDHPYLSEMKNGSYQGKKDTREQCKNVSDGHHLMEHFVACQLNNNSRQSLGNAGEFLDEDYRQ